MPKVVKPQTKLGAKLVGKVRPKQTEPLWKGPESDLPLGGVSQSMLSAFLSCRERFRIKYILGLQPPDQFEKRLEFGNMWHICEEALASRYPKDRPDLLRDKSIAKSSGTTDWWMGELKEYAQDLCREYPLAQEQVSQWYEIILRMFPVYIDYWAKHADKNKRVPLLQEHVFHVPYKLPSGRTVWLKGKWDGVSLEKKPTGIWLDEHKTKGDINEIQLQRQLNFDLQVMFYITALEAESIPIRNLNKDSSDHSYSDDELAGLFKKHPIRGVNYNVIRRPLSGGKGSIRQHQPSKSNPQGESKADFYDRLVNDYIKTEPEYWFMRWKVEVTPTDVERFKTRFLDPILEQLASWYDSQVCLMKDGDDPFADNINNLHWQYPYGCYNPLVDGNGSSEYDEFIQSGNEVGLQKVESLFGELQ